MYPALLRNLSLHIQLAPEEESIIAQHFTEQDVAKNEHLVQQGQICRRLYFVCSGCLRTYYIDDQGNEQNLLLHPDNWWATDIASFSRQKKALLHISALEKTTVCYISFQDLERLFVTLPRLERFFRILYQNGFLFYQTRMMNFLTRSAAERYRIFKKLYPDLELRIPQKHIASFLGITPVFLSILRSRQAKQ